MCVLITALMEVSNVDIWYVLESRRCYKKLGGAPLLSFGYSTRNIFVIVLVAE